MSSPQASIRASRVSRLRRDGTNLYSLFPQCLSHDASSLSSARRIAVYTKRVGAQRDHVSALSIDVAGQRKLYSLPGDDGEIRVHRARLRARYQPTVRPIRTVDKRFSSERDTLRPRRSLECAVGWTDKHWPVRQSFHGANERQCKIHVARRIFVERAVWFNVHDRRAKRTGYPVNRVQLIAHRCEEFFAGQKVTAPPKAFAIGI